MGLFGQLGQEDRGGSEWGEVVFPDPMWQEGDHCLRNQTWGSKCWSLVLYSRCPGVALQENLEVLCQCQTRHGCRVARGQHLRDVGMRCRVQVGSTSAPLWAHFVAGHLHGGSSLHGEH